MPLLKSVGLFVVRRVNQLPWITETEEMYFIYSVFIFFTSSAATNLMQSQKFCFVNLKHKIVFFE